MADANFDVVIVGAGIAGCVLARALGRQGRRILILERSLAQPDPISGELLQPGGVSGVKHLGLGDCLEGIEATPVKGFHLYWKYEQATFWFYPPSASNGSEVENGRSFRHGRFVANLRSAIREDSTVTLIEATAREILRDGPTGRVIGVECSKGNGDSISKYFGDLVVLADGRYSNFRSQFSPYRPKANSRFWGLELVDAQLPLQDYAHSVLGSGPPLLLYQIGSREIRILIDIFHRDFADLRDQSAVKTYILERVLPTLPSEIQCNLRDAVNNGRLRSMANAWMPARRARVPGLIMLGDCANMRHPMTGSGMTVAIKDAILLADLLQVDDVPDLGDSALVLRQLKTFHWKRKRHSATLNILAHCLYHLFASEVKNLEIMQRGFIQFIQGGPKNFAQPVALMGGLVEDPSALFYYFFRIAIFSISTHLRSAQILDLPFAVCQSLCVLFHAIAIIVPAILDEVRT